MEDGARESPRGAARVTTLDAEFNKGADAAHKIFALAGQFNQTNRANSEGAPIDAEQEAGTAAARKLLGE